MPPALETITRDDLDTGAIAKGMRKLALLRPRVEAAYYRQLMTKLGR